MPQAGRDAPLGQRQGGVFRFPPPYLWTPPTPQQAKGYSPLTILKKKSKHKKASAAPVGAIALTLFSLLHLYPLRRYATAPQRGSGPSQALPRQLSQRESQAVKFGTKVLGTKRKLPAVLLALPLGELSPQVTERAHAVSPVTNVSKATRNFPATTKSRPLGEGELPRSGKTEGGFSLSHPQKLKIQPKNAPDGSKNNLDVLY